MDLLRRHPIGLLAVVFATAVYAVARIVASVFGYNTTALVSGAFALLLAGLLLDRRRIAWVGALVFYGLFTLNQAIGMTVEGVRQLPWLVAGLLVLAYLVSNRALFDRSAINSRSDPAE